MTTEQKAKAYDEALKRARQFSEHPLQEDSSNIVEYIFPELQESKDERIRKEIIETFKILGDGKIPVDINYADIFTWLEKQGEKRKITHEEICKSYGISDIGEFSDGYHTFNELYYYRMLYNAAFFNILPKEWVHKSKKHHDGEECFGGGWFIVMANLPTGQVSNHYELKDWDLFQIPEKETADEWDDHTPQEAADRLHKYLLEKQGEQKVWEHVESVTEDDKLHLIMDEQNTAWSEEDETGWTNTMIMIKEVASNHYTKDSIKLVIDWLKSLKGRVQPQKQWKPSAGQMKALHDLNLAGNISYAGQGQILIELYNDLKKLTE